MTNEDMPPAGTSSDPAALQEEDRDCTVSLSLTCENSSATNIAPATHTLSSELHTPPLVVLVHHNQAAHKFS